MSEVQKQGHFTCPNCGTEAWIWSKKDPDFVMPQDEIRTRTCPDCMGRNWTMSEEEAIKSGQVARTQKVVGRDNQGAVYAVCDKCEGQGWILDTRQALR